MVELATISDIFQSPKYPFARFLFFKDRRYQVVVTSDVPFAVGEEVLYIPDGAILPPHLLKYLNLWDSAGKKGILFGSKGNVVRPYRLNGDPLHFSYGMVAKMPQDGILTMGDIQVDLHASKNLSKDLQVAYVEKGMPYYYNTGLFMADINFKKPEIPDLEASYKLFEDSEVYADRLVPGRRFYVIVSDKVKEPQAFGPDHNIFITCQGLKKYVFFSGAYGRSKSNPFIRSVLNSRLITMMQSMCRAKEANGMFTCEIFQNLSSFSGKEGIESGAKSKNMVLTDAFYGTVPFGRFLNRSELNYMARMSNMGTLQNVYEGEFDFDLLQELAEKEPYGLDVRVPGNYRRASLFSRSYREERIRNRFKS